MVSPAVTGPEGSTCVICGASPVPPCSNTLTRLSRLLIAATSSFHSSASINSPGFTIFKDILLLLESRVVGVVPAIHIKMRIGQVRHVTTAVNEIWLPGLFPGGFLLPVLAHLVEPQHHRFVQRL